MYASISLNFLNHGKLLIKGLSKSSFAKMSSAFVKENNGTNKHPIR